MLENLVQIQPILTKVLSMRACLYVSCKQKKCFGNMKCFKILLFTIYFSNVTKNMDNDIKRNATPLSVSVILCYLSKLCKL